MIYIFPSNYYCMTCIENRFWSTWWWIWVLVLKHELFCTAETCLVEVEGNNHTQIERNVWMKCDAWSLSCRGCKSLRLQLHQYATYGLKHNSAVFYDGVAACTVPQVFQIPKPIYTCYANYFNYGSFCIFCNWGYDIENDDRQFNSATQSMLAFVFAV